MSVHLRGLLPPQTIFMASGKGALVSIMDTQGQGPPWSMPPMEVPNTSVGCSPIATRKHTEWLGEAPKEQ